jgi:hypothetical protein
MQIDFIKLCELVEYNDELHGFRAKVEPILLRKVDYEIIAKKQEINEIERQISNMR